MAWPRCTRSGCDQKAEWARHIENRRDWRNHPEVLIAIPWLGFIVYPTHRRMKARKVRDFGRRLRARWRDYCAGRISFAEFDAGVQGWINPVRYADTRGLRCQVLGQPLRFPDD